MWIRFLVPVALALILHPVAARGDGWCGADSVRVSSRSDSIFVSHDNALKEWCLVLGVSAIPLGQMITFYERDDARPCDLYCCFDHLYGAAGIGPGHYTVQVWDEVGSRLYGEQEVDVVGPSGSFEEFVITRGDPLCPEPSAEPTWGRIRLLYR